MKKLIDVYCSCAYLSRVATRSHSPAASPCVPKNPQASSRQASPRCRPQAHTVCNLGHPWPCFFFFHASSFVFVGFLLAAPGIYSFPNKCGSYLRRLSYPSLIKYQYLSRYIFSYLVLHRAGEVGPAYRCVLGGRVGRVYAR